MRFRRTETACPIEVRLGVLRDCTRALTLAALALFVVALSAVAARAQGNDPPAPVVRVAQRCIALAPTSASSPTRYFHPAVCVDKRGYFICQRIHGVGGRVRTPLVLNPGQSTEKVVSARVLTADVPPQTGHVPAVLVVDEQEGPFEVPEFTIIPWTTQHWTAIFDAPSLKDPVPLTYPAVMLRPDRWAGNFRIRGTAVEAAHIDVEGRIMPLWLDPKFVQTVQIPDPSWSIDVNRIDREHEFRLRVENFLEQPVAANVQLYLAAGEEWLAIARPDGKGAHVARVKPARALGARQRHDRLTPIPYRIVAELQNGEKVQREGIIRVLDPAELAENLMTFRDAPLADATVKIPVPEPIADVIPAAGGRMLLLHFKVMKMVGIFDSSERRVVKYLDMKDLDDPLIAAGARKVVALDRQTNRMVRWDLGSMERDCSASPVLPPHAAKQAHRIMVGYASNGPIAVLSYLDAALQLVDLDTLQLLGRLGRPVNDTHILGMWTPLPCDSGPPAADLLPGVVDHIRPPRPRLVRGIAEDAWCFGVGGLADRSRPSSTSAAQMAGEHCVPTCHPGFFLVMRYGEDAKDIKRYNQSVTGINVHSFPDFKRLTMIPTPEVNSSFCNPTNASHRVPPLWDRRVHLIPQANLLITIPDSRDHLLLRRVDVSKLMAASNPRYLLIDSHPPVTAYRGQTLVYEPRVRSAGENVRFEVESAPTALKQVKPGRIEWPVPLDFAEPKVPVTILFRGDPGVEAYQSFLIEVR